jgi:4'-phosphopantetheinyl transferase
MEQEISWERLPGVPDLPENQVHIWRIPLDPPAESLAELRDDLSTEELGRAARFHFERDRRRHIVSHAWLRRLLAACLGLQPSDLQFESAEHGKPHLAGNMADAGLKFNLAHSGEMALVALCRGLEVGVDIEQVRPMPDLEAVAARFFSRDEQSQLSQVPHDQKVRAFFKCWTCKEAFIKQIGDGLYYPLDQFDVDLHPARPARLLGVASDAQEAANWQLVSFPAAEGYFGALAVRSLPALKVRYLALSF